MFSFSYCYLYSKIFESNAYFTQYVQEEMKHVSAFNFMALHFNPDLNHFKLLEDYQLQFHQDIGIDFLRFHWPADQGLYPECFHYFSQNNYQLGQISLLSAKAQDLKLNLKNLNLEFQSLKAGNLNNYLQANLQANLEQGKNYAYDKEKQYRGFLKRPHLLPILAYLNGELLGWMDLVLSKQAIEINSLYVRKKARQQGIASALIEQARQLAKSRQQAIIILADREDFPYHIYLKQGFSDQSQLIIAQKTLKK